eukprot:scpid60364/ scgid27133/ 
MVSSEFPRLPPWLLARLRKQDFLISAPDGGCEIVTLRTEFSTKNYQGGLKGSSFNSAGCISDPQQVAVFMHYLSKLHPDIDRIFQCARVPFGVSLESDSERFMKSPLSHNMLSTMMRKISQEAKLSTAYANHSVRASTIASTIIVKLKKAGVEDRKICAVSGHRNIQSLESYDQTTTTEMKSLSAKIDGKATLAPSKRCHDRDSDLPAKKTDVLANALTFNALQNVNITVVRKRKLFLSRGEGQVSHFLIGNDDKR